MIVSVVTSVDYSDFLSVTLPRLSSLCDKTFVLTKPSDESIGVARKHGCSVMEYDGWNENGADFNKSGALSSAQDYVHEHYPESWVIIADADILLPETLRHSIEFEANDYNALYSVPRIDFHTPEDYANRQAKYYPFPFSGYCQIYRRKDHTYQPWSRTASHCDCFFRDHFDKWIRLPGVAEHLGADMVNWCGRKSPQWKTYE